MRRKLGRPYRGATLPASVYPVAIRFPIRERFNFANCAFIPRRVQVRGAVLARISQPCLEDQRYVTQAD
jgi:hypothetical protein